MPFVFFCLCAQSYITYKSSQSFAFVIFLLDVQKFGHVKFISQCELINNLSEVTINNDGIFVQFDKSERSNI